MKKMKKTIGTIRWYLKGLKALWDSRNTNGYNAYRRWARANHGRKHGRGSKQEKRIGD